MPSYGNTVVLDGWTISLARLGGPASSIYWSDVGNGFDANGKFWMVYIDGKNNVNATRAIINSIHWTLVDDQGAWYDEMAMGNAYEMSEYATLNGRDPQDVSTTLRGYAHIVLVFDVAADAKPAQLRANDQLSSDLVIFNLSRKKK